MNTTREQVELFLSLLGQGDTERAAALFADSVDFQIPHDEAIWWIPPVSTRAELRAFFAGLGTHLLTESFDVDRILVDGDDAVVIGRLTDTVRRTSRSFTSPFALHLSQRDGLFTRYLFLEDSAAARAAALGESAPTSN